jgi:hypothetical protein
MTSGFLVSSNALAALSEATDFPDFDWISIISSFVCCKRMPAARQTVSAC